MPFNLSKELGGTTAASESPYQPVPMVDANRRRTDMILAHWEDCRGGRMLPTWADHVRVVGGGLEDYCVAGHFGYARSEVVTTRIGGHFLEQLNNGPDASGHTTYPAAVVIGVILTQSEQLFHDPYPLVRDGEFLNMHYVRIRYRTIVLPFGEGRSAADHWLALGSWAVTGEKPELVRAA